MIESNVIDQLLLPINYPTHKQPAEFWESLGRAVATFGLLEEVLCKAIFAFTVTRRYSDAEISSVYEEWLQRLERSLSDPLGNLIDTFGKALREHPEATILNLDDLLKDLRAVSKVRNVLCHGSWRAPDSIGASIPFFVNKQNERFDTPIDKEWLEVTRQHAVELICAVINSVTHMGLHFPGSSGPGIPVWNNS